MRNDNVICHLLWALLPMLLGLLGWKNVSAQNLPHSNAVKPNVIIIMADDLGYGDTSVYDGSVKTPRLERVAAERPTFTDFHSNSPVCCATRAAFMTGRYQPRVGIVDVIVGRRDTHGLSTDELTILRLMKQAGYNTALFGKWHLVEPVDFNPLRHGFHEFIGYLLGVADYQDHRGSWHDGL